MKFIRNFRHLQFLSAYSAPDTSFSRINGAPPEIEKLYLEWCRCHGDWEWIQSDRGRYVDEALEQWERRHGA